jgi:hypothetical protein
MLHHVLPLEELATSDLKYKIDYTQSRTQPQSKLRQACISKDAYRKVGALVEHAAKVLLLLDSSWRGHGNLGNTHSLRVGQPLLCCLSFETWMIPKGRQRKGEKDRLDGYFCVAPSQKLWQQKMVPKQSR